jgi:hypothetical protein
MSLFIGSPVFTPASAEEKSPQDEPRDPDRPVHVTSKPQAVIEREGQHGKGEPMQPLPTFIPDIPNSPEECGADDKEQYYEGRNTTSAMGKSTESGIPCVE